MAIEFINGEKAEVISKGQGVKIVNFFATWCGPCKMMAPTFEEISETHNVFKIDVDENKEYATSQEITSIPTTFVFKDGKIVDKIIGYAPKEKILEKV